MEITNQQIDIFTCGMTFMIMIYMAMRSFQPNGVSYRNYALYLLLDIDVPFAPDPARCFPAYPAPADAGS